MSLQDLAGYHFQLSQVTEALERNPENAELIKLQSDLKELISLAESLCEVEREGAKQATSEKKKNHRSSNGSRSKWSTGQTVRARWGDGKFYTATIEALPDSKQGQKLDSDSVVVRFKDYDEIECVNLNDICKFTPESNDTSNEVAADTSKQQPGNTSVVVPHVPVTPATVAATSNSTVRPKKKYKPKNYNAPTTADSQQTSKQNAWLSFLSSGSASGDAKNSKRKACSAPLVKPILKKPSMFSTSDHPSARVGVIGSGKPMTQFHQRGKHIFPLKT